MAETKLRARFLLGLVALFLGELRDGLTMLNMQNAFLIVSMGYSEKQAGVLFVVFGLTQFLFQTPAGYIMDYTDWKVAWLALAAVTTTALTLLTATTATYGGANLGWMVAIKVAQGAVTALIPPGLNSITQGIVGADGMTRQVADNEMRNHFGTAVIVLAGSLIAFLRYPDIGMLFAVSPIACAGVVVFLLKIDPADIDHNAARGLTASDDDAPKGADYNATDASGRPTSPIGNASFDFGGAPKAAHVDGASSPLTVLRDPTLLTFVIIVFLFHMSNGSILPLVMQTLAIGEGKTGILMSGLCIIVAQATMVASAKVCGDYSGVWGRKSLFLVGLCSVPVRCLILYALTGLKGEQEETSQLLSLVILATQLFDGVGAGVFGTMYILVTSDISAGTGRFSLSLGVTTAAMSIGGTVSGYLGQALAQDHGYQNAFMILGLLACVPAVGYLVFMPETLHRKDGVGMSVIEEESRTDHEEKPTVV